MVSFKAEVRRKLSAGEIIRSPTRPGGRTRSQYEGADEFNYLVVKVKGY